jgi:DNA-binding CsgD family transcriptional regulator
MALLSTAPPQAWQEVDAAHEIAAVFAAAPHAVGGWCNALELLREGAGAQEACLVAVRGQARWVVASTGLGQGAGGPVVADETILRTADVEFQICLSGRCDVHEVGAAQRLLSRIAPAAGAAAQTELGIQLEAFRMSLLIMRMAGMRPVACGAGGALWPAGAGQELLELHPRLQLAAGRVRCCDPRDEAVLRGGLARAAEHRQRQTLVLGAGEDDPLITDILPPVERHGVAFSPWLLLLPRCRDSQDASRSPIVQELFGLTPSETAVAIGIADGVSVGVIAERRGVAPSTVRAQVKTVLAKVGVRRQVELAHRLAAIC